MYSKHNSVRLALCVFLAISISAQVQSASLKSKRGVTLDPDTWRQVQARLGTSSEPTIKLTQNSEDGLVFEDSNAIGTRLETKKSPEPETTLGARDSLVFQDDLPMSPVSNKKAASHTCSNPKQRYHLVSGNCFTVGKTGTPCGENMLFYANDEDKIYGTCDCIENYEVPLVFNPDTGKCHETYQRAYCPKNYWLVFDATQTPICEPRKCPNGKVYFHERCVKLDESDKDCQKSEKILFREGELTPSCGDGSTSEFSNLSGPKLKCRPGSSQDVVGKCRQNIKFNLNG